MLARSILAVWHSFKDENKRHSAGIIEILDFFRLLHERAIVMYFGVFQSFSQLAISMLSMSLLMPVKNKV